MRIQKLHKTNLYIKITYIYIYLDTTCSPNSYNLLLASNSHTYIKLTWKHFHGVWPTHRIIHRHSLTGIGIRFGAMVKRAVFVLLTRTTARGRTGPCPRCTKIEHMRRWWPRLWLLPLYKEASYDNLVNACLVRQDKLRGRRMKWRYLNWRCCFENSCHSAAQNPTVWSGQRYTQITASTAVTIIIW